MIKKNGRQSLVVLFATIVCMIVAAAVLAFVTASVKTSAESEPSRWDGNLVAAGWADTENSKTPAPQGYVLNAQNKTLSIGTAAAFAYFAHEVYANAAALEGFTVTLTTDIDLDDRLWIPIGIDNRKNPRFNYAFKGVFDGNGHTVYGLNGTVFAQNLVAEIDGADSQEKLYVNIGDNANSKVYIPSDSNEFSFGLFGGAANVTIKDLTVAEFVMDLSNITTTLGGKKIEADGVGGLIGIAGGTVSIQNCTVGAPKTTANKDVADIAVTRVTGGLIGRAYVAVDSEGNFCQTSGICNPVEIVNCKNYLNIGKIDDPAQKGGIIGFANGLSRIELRNCENYGNINGEYAGGMTSFIQQSSKADMIFAGCYNEGNITASDRSAGGIIGYITSASLAKFSDCTNKGTITAITKRTSTGYQYTAGIVGGLSGSMTATEAFSGENLYNYGTIVGASSDEEHVTRRYVGGVIGNIAFGEDHATSTAWINAGKVEADYPYAMAKVKNLVNCGKVTSAGEYRGTQLYVGGVFGAVESNLVPYAQISRLYIDGIVNTDGSVNTIDYTGNIGTGYDMREGVVYRPLDKVDLPEQVSTVELRLSEDGKTVLGVDGDPEGAIKVVIPDTVTAIATGAFMGMGTFTEKGISEDYLNRGLQRIFSDTKRQLVEVEFEDGSVLENIGDLAFAGTDIRSITLPASVKTVGRAAFASTQLETITLCSGATKLGDTAFGNNVHLVQVNYGAGSIDLGNDVFSKHDNIGYVIAVDKVQYDDIAQKVENATYPVKIEYYDLSTSVTIPVGEEYKLHGVGYKYVQDERGLWVENEAIDYVGLSTLGGNATAWYGDADCSGTALTVDSIAELLNGEGEVIKLYTRTVGISDTYIARTDLVYDGTVYPTTAINVLLAPNSKKASSSTVITVKSYTKPGATDSDAAAPTSFGNAGTYEVEISEDGAETQTINIVIARATVTLSDATLDWRINGNITLLDRTVYVYNNGEYVSLQPDRGQGTPVALSVVESVVRSRGNVDLTLDLFNAADKGYACVGQYNVANNSEVGKYTSVFTLTADDNHVLTLGNITGATARGLNIEIVNGTATVTKTWYVVDMDNWFINATGGDYAIADRTYGDTTSFILPLLYRNNNNGDAEVTYTLYRGNTSIATFAAADFDKYLNSALPVGNYTLRMAAGAVDYTEYEEYNSDGTPVESSALTLHCDAFYQEVTFVVEEGAINQTYGDTIITALDGRRFDFILGAVDMGQAGVSAKTAVDAALENIRLTLPVSAGENNWTVGVPTVEINPANAMSNVYSANFAKPETAGVFTYYFRISVPNYSMISSNEDEQLLSFTVAAFSVVDIPTVATTEYNGFAQSAVIAESDNYRVVENAGGINAATYSVRLELINPECHIWAGQTIDDRTVAISLDFQIVKTTNRWLKTPNIVNWTFETFDSDINRLRAVPFFNEGAILHFAVARDEAGTDIVAGLTSFAVDADGKVTDDTIRGLLNSLPVGSYYLVATVDDTVNYGEMTQVISFNVNKSFNSWADGENDLVLPSWVVGSYDANEIVMTVNAAHGVTNIIIIDLDGNEYYNSVTGVDRLSEAPVGKYLLKAWVDETTDYAALAERTFTFEVFEKAGLPWWAVLLIVVGALGVAALIIFILWKKGVFQILTGKLVIAIRTKATVDATIAAVRANKVAAEGRKSVEEAKRREQAEERKAKAAEERALPVEAKAAALEEKAKIAAQRAEKMRARAEGLQLRAERMREKAAVDNSAPFSEAPKTEDDSAVRAEAAATDDGKAPNEE